jgi:hypothetical protein
VPGLMRASVFGFLANCICSAKPMDFILNAAFMYVEQAFSSELLTADIVLVRGGWLL